MSDFRGMIRQEMQEASLAYSFGVGGKHPYVEWFANGVRQRFHYPSTPGDNRSIMNNRAELRRRLGHATPDAEPVEAAEARLPALSLIGGGVWCSSLGVAEKFSKSHRDVLRAIDRIIGDVGPEFASRNFMAATYTDASNRQSKAFNLSRDGFSMVVMGFTGSAATKWKISYLEAFNTMERELTALPRLELQQKIAWLEGELKALADLVMELPGPVSVPFDPPRVKKQFIARRSVIRRMLNGV